MMTTLSKTATMQAERAIKKLIREAEVEGVFADVDDWSVVRDDVDAWLADKSYDEAEARRVTTVPQFDSGAHHNRAYDNWMAWREYVEAGVRAHFRGGR